MHARVAAGTGRGNAARRSGAPRRRGRAPTPQGVTEHQVDDLHDELLEYVLRLDSAWQDRVGSALRRVLPTERVTGFWLRTGRLESPEAGAVGTLDLVVVTACVLAHVEFGASLAGQRWCSTTRTRAWPLCLIAAVTTETLPAEPEGSDGLLVTMVQPGGGWDVQLRGSSAEPDGAAGEGLAGTVVPSVVRIVVEPLAGAASPEQLRRQRAEHRMLIGVATAVHQQLGRWPDPAR